MYKTIVLLLISLLLIHSIEISLHGSGTTNPSKYFWKMMEDIETRARVPLQMTYRAVGSSTGIKEFINQENGFAELNHFGSGDLPIPAEQYYNLTTIGGIEMVHFPIAIGAVSVFFNMPDYILGNNVLDLDACLLARIFSANITSWAHPDIVAKNPFLDVPVLTDFQTIKVAHRVFGSSSTSGLTQYLEAACPSEWTLGSGATITWPVGTFGVQGSGNLVQFLVDTEFSIGYLEAGHGHARNLPEVSLENKDGYLVNTKTADIGNAATVAINDGIIPGSGTDDFSTVSLINLEGRTTWPITLFTYVYVRQDLTSLGNTSSLLVAFLEFILSDESQDEMAETFDFTKLPDAIKSLNTASLALLQLPADNEPFQFETIASTQPIVGAGDRVISGKRNRYVDVAIAELIEKTINLEAENELLKVTLEGLRESYESVLNQTTTLAGKVDAITDGAQPTTTDDDTVPVLLGALGLIFGLIALVVAAVIGIQKSKD